MPQLRILHSIIFQPVHGSFVYFLLYDFQGVRGLLGSFHFVTKGYSLSVVLVFCLLDLFIGLPLSYIAQDVLFACRMYVQIAQTLVK